MQPATIETASPAEVYDARFVPALFAQWGPVVARAAGVAPGRSVLDVACGTGAATLAAVRIAGPGGSVTGLDASPDMLAVARRKPASVTWVEGRAEALPFADAAFDAAISQFGFMFFADRIAALHEMLRVLRPGGRLAVAVCDGLDRSDGYGRFARLLAELFGAEVAAAFAAPFVLGDVGALQAIAAEAGLAGAQVTRHSGQVRFDSIADLVAAERACVWTLGGVLDDAQFARLLGAAETALAPFRQPDGRVAFEMPALILTAKKPA